MIKSKRSRLAAPALAALCMFALIAGAAEAGAPRARRSTGGLRAALRLAADGGKASVAATSGHWQVVARGLNNPRGIDIGPRGAIYIAEAGRGGPRCLDEFTCVGTTASVTKVWRGDQRRFIRGVSSLAESTGAFAFGLHDVSVPRAGRTFFTVGGPFNLDLYRALLPEGRWLGHLSHKFDRRGKRLGAFLARYEARHNPDRGPIDSDPYSVVAVKGARYVTDAAGNDLLRVGRHGIRTVAVFPERMVDFNGEQIPMQAVPTGMVKGPDGALYVGELTGFPFPVGAARVYRIVPGHKPQVYARGFTNIIDIAFDPRGRLHVLEIAKNSLLSDDPTGALIRVNRNGSRTTVASDGLVSPGGLAIGPSGRILVSNCGVCPGTGTNPATGSSHGEVVQIPH